MSNWGNLPSEGGKAGRQGGPNHSTSHSSGPDFSNLAHQKRSGDEVSQKRRASLAEQSSSGFFGRMWKRWVSDPRPGS
ncbi:hypothetical protein GGR52DRAFT_568352 [Hypoxylon sp. FL1284]|nr:hypothetical protein GGR52DRAFT_568352 [Hypoxylon sp. FL1284]